jgi:hypothetical protein
MLYPLLEQRLLADDEYLDFPITVIVVHLIFSLLASLLARDISGFISSRFHGFFLIYLNEPFDKVRIKFSTGAIFDQP